MTEPWEDRYNYLDALLIRIAALVAPLAETVNEHDARLAQHEENMTELRRINASLAVTLQAIKDLLERGNGR
mgnify:CR=1 FL=1